MQNNENSLFSEVYRISEDLYKSEQLLLASQKEELLKNKELSYSKLNSLLSELKPFENKSIKTGEVIELFSGNLSSTNSIEIKLSRQGKVIPFILISLLVNSKGVYWSLSIRNTNILSGVSQEEFRKNLINFLALEIKPILN